MNLCRLVPSRACTPGHGAGLLPLGIPHHGEQAGVPPGRAPAPEMTCSSFRASLEVTTSVVLPNPRGVAWSTSRRAEEYRWAGTLRWVDIYRGTPPSKELSVLCGQRSLCEHTSRKQREEKGSLPQDLSRFLPAGLFPVFTNLMLGTVLSLISHHI